MGGANKNARLKIGPFNLLQRDDEKIFRSIKKRRQQEERKKERGWTSTGHEEGVFVIADLRL